MKVVSEYGNDLAKVYVAEMREGKGAVGSHMVEFVESVQPPHTREEKWVLIVSSMFGCPIKCKMCDAGGDYAGKLTADEILSQIAYLVERRFPSGRIPVAKLKVQFARMGEPTMNPAVLEAMETLPQMFDAPGLNVSLSTVAPKTEDVGRFFEDMLRVKERLYAGGRFQLQFSIHTTDPTKRDELVPVKKWSFREIASYGKRFSKPETGDKKVTLNFAPMIGYPIDATAVRREFDPDRFMIKFTPMNPTVRSSEQSLSSAIDPEDRRTSDRLTDAFRREGFDVILSIGELEENRIGSNCGQFIQRAMAAGRRPENSYELGKYVVQGDG